MNHLWVNFKFSPGHPLIDMLIGWGGLQCLFILTVIVFPVLTSNPVDATLKV